MSLVVIPARYTLWIYWYSSVKKNLLAEATVHRCTIPNFVTDYLFDKIVGWYLLLKGRLWHRFFLCEFWKLLKNTFGRLILGSIKSVRSNNLFYMLRLEAFQNMLLVKTDVLLVRFWYLLRHEKITLHVDENWKNRLSSLIPNESEDEIY